jgi:NAD(P)H-dependent flavin oxidoreductase YrpB (nitropropane dioxygenase family)
MARCEVDSRTLAQSQAFLMGQVAAVIDSIEPAKKIIDDMVAEAVEQMKLVAELTKPVARL